MECLRRPAALPQQDADLPARVRRDIQHHHRMVAATGPEKNVARCHGGIVHKSRIVQKARTGCEPKERFKVDAKV